MLIERTVRLLKTRGVGRTFVVTGYARNEISPIIDTLGCEAVYNPFFATTNTLCSLWLALQRVVGPVVIVNGDTIFSGAILEAVLNRDGSWVLACDDEKCGEEEMKYQCMDGAVRRISKEIDPEEAHGEFIGLSKLSAAMVAAVRAACEEILAAGQFSAYYEAAYDALLDRGASTASVVKTSIEPWCEIDFPADLDRARELFPTGGSL